MTASHPALWLVCGNPYSGFTPCVKGMNPKGICRDHLLEIMIEMEKEGGSIQLHLESRDAHNQHLDLCKLNSYQQSLSSNGFAYLKNRSMHCLTQGFGRVKSA